jgi:lysine 2,3-aminomutase
MNGFAAAKLPDYLRARIGFDQHDPLALQYIKSVAEDNDTAYVHDDPIGDHAHSKNPLIIHRYPDRALFLPTDHCAVYCRFCFRKDRVGQGAAIATEADLDTAFTYLETHPAIWEVIFSGGDPLILSPRRLQTLMTRLAALPHIEVVRFHTRLPAVDPKRITQDLAKALSASGKATYLVLHVNHADELTPEALVALKLLHEAGIILLSQTVLLKDVNNNTETLEHLLRKLVAHRVKPYYLHHPDLVKGTQHFRVSLDEGMQIMKELRGKISGLCWPTYVLDIPGGFGKVPVNQSYITKSDDTTWVVEDIYGASHIYPPHDKKQGTA